MAKKARMAKVRKYSQESRELDLNMKVHKMTGIQLKYYRKQELNKNRSSTKIGTQ